MSTPTIQQALQTAVQHHRARNFREAEALYRQILGADPRHPDALHLLGLLAQQTGHGEAAAQLIAQALAIQPNSPVALSNLAGILIDLGRIAEAIVHSRHAVSLQPDFPEGLGNLGNALMRAGQFPEAINCFRKAVALKPDYFEAHNNLGNALKDVGRFNDAIASFRNAMAIRPDQPECYNNLGNMYCFIGKFDEGIDCFDKAIALRPEHSSAHNNLGNAYKDFGQLDKAMACYRQAISIKPDYVDAHSNLLMVLSYHPDSTHQSILQESLRWGRQHADPLSGLIQPHANDRNPDRRLRIGYVSSDLREHSIATFLLPLLTGHDHKNFEVFCYAHVSAPDAMTQRLRAHADAWRNIVGLNDQQAADLIRQDRIDILIDLSLHTAGNRLTVFACKPAPVQVTYLAYCSTSGMAAMDYRITDPYLDPPGVNDACYSERSIHLPQTYWCYQPSIAMPDPGPLPALTAGHITFGSLNNFCKVSPRVLETWCQLLLAVPESELVLYAKEGSHRRQVSDAVMRHGVDIRRVRFVAHAPIAQYFATYNGIDIALDPFPFNGGTTTCDALWMGVPVVSLAGKTAVSRGGLSILSNVGLQELVARDAPQYLEIAARLASDLPRLTDLRTNLRQMMHASPLMDAPPFARNMEEAYRTMWRKWCSSVR